MDEESDSESWDKLDFLTNFSRRGTGLDVVKKDAACQKATTME